MALKRRHRWGSWVVWCGLWACALPGLAGAAELAASPPAVPDTLTQRLQACTVCHGKEGRSTNQGYFPRIAGKPAGYLYQQLLNFREGRRHNRAMTVLLDQMSDAYLREIAEHFAALELPYPPPQTVGAAPAVLAQGERLVRQGDAARQLPPCVSCHGHAMTGLQPAVPGLLGLPRDYLIGQLGAWRTGQRHAAAPDCMATLVRGLSSDDITALATWLSAQPVPSPAKAVKPSRGDAPAPLACGSMAR